MNIRETKEIDMVQFLSRLGHELAEIKGKNYWYLSPLRSEKAPSFKVNAKMNRWYDWGEGKGGNLVDFGTLYYRCSVADFLKKLDGSLLSINHRTKQEQTINSNDEEKNQIKILTVKSLTSFPLLRYLEKRKISRKIADQFCSEITYRLNDKKYYAIGFSNNSGGYELRNEYIKGSSSPKDITFIDKGAKDPAVFEGFFNFLSYLALYQNREKSIRNFLILNSTSFFEKSLPLMQPHKAVHLYLDHDKTGEKFTRHAISLDKEKFKDERQLYQKYSDLNDWLMNFGRQEKNRLYQRL